MPPRSALIAASCVAAATIAFSHIALAQQRGAAQPAGARDVTVAAIPGVVSSGARWQLVWQGTDNADGLVGYTLRAKPLARDYWTLSVWKTTPRSGTSCARPLISS